TEILQEKSHIQAVYIYALGIIITEISTEKKAFNSYNLMINL
ncbi:35316_t:CDS:1, partial [Gigaspora margarita]